MFTFDIITDAQYAVHKRYTKLVLLVKYKSPGKKSLIEKNIYVLELKNKKMRLGRL